MTTGEKLSKLRRENNYTQEQLADLLNVSRQSISKWESDVAFPETDKLIQISKLFNCSIDYLLKVDIEQKEEPKENFFEKSTIENNSNETTKIYTKKFKNLFHLIWALSYFALSLFFYSFPILNVAVNITGYQYYTYINTYQIIFTSNYQNGNFMFLLAFLCTIAQTIIGVLISFKNSKKLFLARNILAFSSFGIFTIIAIIFFSISSVTIAFVPIISLTNAILLVVLKKNKFQA